MKIVAPILAGVFAFGLLLWTAPVNRSEAEDAYYYAMRVEQPSAAREYHAHHALYLPTGRILYRAANALGLEVRGLEVLSAWSRVSGAVCVGLLVWLLGRMGRPAGPAALGLLGSYGFWRYSAEAEIYAPVMALSLLALVAAVRPGSRSGPWAVAVLLAGALLLHVAALAAWAGVTAVLWDRGRRRAALGVGFGAALLAGGVLAALHAKEGLVLFSDPGVARAGGIGALARAVPAFGHTLVSGNFIFANPAWADAIQRMFPGRLLTEEVFMGRHAPAGTIGLAGFTLAVVVVAGIARMADAIRARRADPADRDRRALARGACVWMALSAAAALWIEPGNPEMWLMALPAVWLWIGLTWNSGPRFRAWLPWGFSAALLAHNWVGGLRLLRDPAGDYLARKADAVAGLAGPGGIVLTADSHVFVTHLAYRTGAEVLDAKHLSLESFNRSVRSRPDTPGRVWVYDDVWNPLPPVLCRRPEDVRRLRELGDALRAETRSAGEASGWGLHEWRAGGWPEPDPDADQP
jgi:hypothetical protein